MSYQALFRKYRSQTFDDLVGQDHVVQTLKNSIAKGKIAQVYLFTGPRGTGKTSTARLLAKALNCTGGPSAEPPTDCPICADIAAGNCFDVVEMDAASESGVDKVREHIVEASEYRPSECRYRIFIIDEVHDLSAKAFDALLKTIEEPPAHAVFILATTEFHKVPPTIRSRCQKFEFHRGTVANLVKRLTYVAEQEGIEVEPAALTAIARMSDGGYRDALTLLEQAMVTAEGAVTLDHVYAQLGLIGEESADELLQAVSRGDIAAIMDGLEAIYQRGRDPQSILESLMYRLADMTRALVSVGGLGDAAVEAALGATANRIGQDTLLRLRAEIAQRHRAVREVTLPRVWLEAELIKVALDLRAGHSTAATRKEVRPSPESRVPEPAAEPVAEKANPAPTPRQRPQPDPNPSTEPATVASAEPTTVEPAAPSGGEAIQDPEEAWSRVRGEMMEISKAARIHLNGSTASAGPDGKVTVILKTQVNVDWVAGNGKLIQAIRKSWLGHTGHEQDFEFSANGKRQKAAPQMEGVSVESALQGDRLAEAAKRIFGPKGAASDQQNETP